MSQQFISGQKVIHERYGKGTIMKVEELFYSIDFGPKGLIDITRRNESLLTPVYEDELNAYSEDSIERRLIDILERFNGISETVEIGDKWQGGKLILQPANASLKPKEVPVETFFHKIVMVRDRLRVLEQQINSNSKLDDTEKINLQQYITRIYGSLTTFNVLFKDPDDYFVGEKTKD
jgi:hypothetical protein